MMWKLALALPFFLVGCATTEYSTNFGATSRARLASYSGCVQNQAAHLGLSGDPAEDVVKVAFKKCEADMKLYEAALVSDIESKGIKPKSAKFLSSKSMNRATHNITEDAKVSIMEARARQAASK